MDFQQHLRYMRPLPPPPPSMVDPHHQLPPRQTVPQPPGPWFSGQFQYQLPASQQSPSPPPPQQWAPPPPHSDHLPSHPYPAPPYPAHPFHNQYPPPPYPPLGGPHMPPSQYPHSQIPQSYPQDWGNPSRGHHQGWKYPAHHKEEDWAAKAKAWAAAKAETDNQQHFASVGRPEEQGHYHDQYTQIVEPRYSDDQLPSVPASGYQQYPTASFPQRPVSVHPQESAPIAPGQYGEHFSYGFRDGKLAADSNVAFLHQESPPTTASFYQQEVSSSYSSVAGKEGDQVEKFQKSLPIPVDTNQFPRHVNPSLPAAGGRSVSMEQPHYPFGHQLVIHTTDLSDQPLEFTHKFNHAHNPHMQPSYTESDSGATSVHTWTPIVASSTVYPPIPPVAPSGQQHDPSLALASSVPGPNVPLFGRMSGPSFQPPIPSVGAPFGISAASGLDPTVAFPTEAYGVSSVSERPKKASVPNWLREEIIKNKASIASSAPEYSKEEAEYTEDENADKPLAKADQADSKSIDSSRSTEEEGDDEDDIEAARTAAINQQIKRVLTEVLLKVTDELFDEIATKVLGEDDLTAEVDHNVVASHKVSPSARAVPTPKASAMVLITAKSKETKTEDDSHKLSSSSPGNVLGLATYASDDDEDDEIQTSAKSDSKDGYVQQQHGEHLSEDKRIIENGQSQEETEKHGEGPGNLHGGAERSSSNSSSAVGRELSDNRTGRESYESYTGSGDPAKITSQIVEGGDHFLGEKVLDGANAYKPKGTGENMDKRAEYSVENVHVKRSTISESESKETRRKQEKNGRFVTKKNSSGEDSAKELESDKYGADVNHSRKDENHAEKERTENKNGSKEKMKEQGGKSGEKTKESDSRKKSTHSDVKEERKEKDKGRGTSAKDDSDRSKQKKDDRSERSKDSRRKHSSKSNRHKRRRSSSIGSRGRTGKDDSVVSHAYDSSNESSDGAERMLHLRKDTLSPSPIRSRRRQDLRSPHSKHSQRRHSPYSSFESTRGRRSRSRSPLHRKK